MFHRKILFFSIVVSMVLLGLSIFLASGYKEKDFIDVNSGKQKTEYMFFNYIVIVHVKETPFSILLEQNGFLFTGENWKPTSCWTLFPYGWECYTSGYGGCPSDTNGFANAMDSVQEHLSPEERLFFLKSQLKRIQNFPKDREMKYEDTPAYQLMLRQGKISVEKLE